MKKTVFENSDLSLLIEILKGLFPEFQNIIVTFGDVGIVVTFKTTANMLMSKLFPAHTSIRKSLHELLWKEIPLRLSYRKAGNASFTYIYYLGIMSVMMEEPGYIIKYLNRKFKEISNPYKKDFDLLISDIEVLESQATKDNDIIEKLLHTISIINKPSQTVKTFFRTR